MGRVLAILVAGAACGAQAQDKKPALDVNRGQQIAGQVCAACHGADGNSAIAMNPKLAGQHADYLYKQLLDYTVQPKAKVALRENAVMAGFAASLSDEDKRNVAAYFAAQKLKPGTAKVKETLDLGQRIYRSGVAERAVPACSGCHGPNGAGIPSQYPRLGGQYAEYTEAQLKAFRDGTRRNNEAMQQIAARLSDREIKAIADYIAGLR
jgi:cytochrome c553